MNRTEFHEIVKERLDLGIENPLELHDEYDEVERIIRIRYTADIFYNDFSYKEVVETATELSFERDVSFSTIIILWTVYQYENNTIEKEYFTKDIIEMIEKLYHTLPKKQKDNSMKNNLFDESQFEEVNEELEKISFYIDNKKEIDDFVDCLKPNKKLKKELWNVFGKSLVRAALGSNPEIFTVMSNPMFVPPNEYDKILDEIFNTIAEALKEGNNDGEFNILTASIISKIEEE